MKRATLALLVLAPLLGAGSIGSRVLYVGGTVAGVAGRAEARIDTLGPELMKFSTKKQTVEIPYGEINTLEYGLRVSRRYLEAALISPLFLVSKKKTHFLSIGYTDAEGKQQAMVLQVNKDEIRPLLVTLEARTGRKVEFQDEEARKAGKG